MAKKGTLTGSYDALPWILRILIQVIFGYFVGAIYRIVRYLESRNVVTLVIGILCFFGLGFIFWVIDLVTTVLGAGISILAA